MRQAPGMADTVASTHLRRLPAVDLVDSMMVIIIAAILIILRYPSELRSSIITHFQRFISEISSSVLLAVNAEEVSTDARRPHQVVRAFSSLLVNRATVR
jgi:hypothetical protein